MNQADITLENVHAYMSIDNVLQFGLLLNTGNANMSFINVTNSAYMTLTVSYPLIGLFPTPVCLPDDDVLQTVTFDGYISTLHNNKGGEKMSLIMITPPIYTTRYYLYTFANSVFKERDNDHMLAFGISGFYNSDTVLKNITITNSTSYFLTMKIVGMNNMFVDGIYQDDFTHYGAGLWTMMAINLDIQNIVINNTHTSSPEALWISLKSPQITRLSDVLIENSCLYQSPLIEFEQPIGHGIMLNFTARNVTLHSDSSIIKFGGADSFEASQMSFTDIRNFNGDSSNNYLLWVEDIVFTRANTTLHIHDVTADNSAVGVIMVADLTRAPIMSNTLVFGDIYVSE